LGSKSVSTTEFVIWSNFSCKPQLAQLVEHQTSYQKVVSSNPTGGRILF
jgi:hypothetical protein